MQEILRQAFLKGSHATQSAAQTIVQATVVMMNTTTAVVESLSQLAAVLEAFAEQTPGGSDEELSDKQKFDYIVEHHRAGSQMKLHEDIYLRASPEVLNNMYAAVVKQVQFEEATGYQL